MTNFFCKFISKAFKFLGDHSLEPTMYGFNIRVDLPGKCLYNTELGDKIHALGSDVDINLLLQKGQLKKGYVYQDYVKCVKFVSM